MKNIRRWHLYLSCFFAPLLIFFTATGWYQTVTPNRVKQAGEQQDLVSKLTSIHVDQIYPADKADSFSPTLFKWLVIVMSICLLITVALGIYLAFTAGRPKWAVWLSLAMGILLPVLFLWLGNK